MPLTFYAVNAVFFQRHGFIYAKKPNEQNNLTKFNDFMPFLFLLESQ